MDVFTKNKKDMEEKKESSCCDGSCVSKKSVQAECDKAVSGVKVLGGGCKKCNELEKATLEALTELGMDASIEHVTDFAQIAAYGVMTTPALMVDGSVVSYGKVLKKSEIIKLLQKSRE
ncbi:MAG: thioredoxin family protein [Clostridia bacterium]